MEGVKEMLEAALDEQNPQFQEAGQRISELQNGNPEEVMPIFFEILQDKTINYKEAFLSLVILRHCFQNNEIPISYGHPMVETNLSDEIIKILFEISFSFFPFPHESVRNAASVLCTTIFCTQWERLEEFGVISTLVGFLTDITSIEAVAPALQCISVISSRREYHEAIGETILPIAFKLISEQQENVEIVSKSIEMLSVCVNSLSKYFDSDASFVSFLEELLSMLPSADLKMSIYSFFDVVLCTYPSKCVGILEQLLQNVISDITTSEEEQLVCNLFNILKCIACSSVINGKDDPEVNVMPVMIEATLQIILDTMEASNHEEVLDYEEWRPYTVAFSTLESYISVSSEIILQPLIEYVQANAESEDANKREVCMKIMNAVFRIPGEECNEFIESIYEDSYALITQRFEDPSVRVIYYALSAVKSIIDRFNDSSERYLELFPPLLALFTENLTVNEMIFNVIKSIVFIPDFSNYEAMTQLIEAVAAFPHDQMINWLMQILLTLSRETTDSGFINQVINFTLQFMTERVEVEDCESIISDLFISLGKFIEYSSSEIEEIVPQIIEFSFQWMEHECTTPLEAIASLIVKQSPSVAECVPNFLEVLDSSLNQGDNEDIVLPALSAFGKACTPELLGESFIPFLDKVINLIKTGKGASVKSSVLQCLNHVLRRGISGIEQQIIQIVGTINEFVGMIHNAYFMYLKDTNPFLTNIALILVTLIDATELPFKNSVAKVSLKFITATLVEDKYAYDTELISALMILVSKLLSSFPGIVGLIKSNQIIKNFIISNAPQ